MLESRELLSAKVDEAVQVLQAHQAKEAAAQAANTAIEKKWKYRTVILNDKHVFL